MTRSVVTLQKLFANQTNVFNIKLDKEVFLLPSRLKYSLGSPMFFWTQPWWKILTEGWPKCWPASSCLVARGRLPECKETFLFIHAFSTVFSRLPVPSNYKQSFQDFAFSMFFFNFCVHFVYCWIVFNFFYRYHFSLLSFIFHFFTVHLLLLNQGWPNFLDRGPFLEIWTKARATEHDSVFIFLHFHWISGLLFRD